jgi:hypothetical protein
MVAPTRAGLEATPSNGDYVALSQQLAAPLGALIVALRDNSPTAPQYLASFNRAADQVSPAIARDVSIDANRLRSAIIYVREAAERRDIATLERIRLQLLEVR